MADPISMHEFKAQAVANKVIDGGPKPPDDGGMEARVAKLESAAEYTVRELTEIKSEMRILREQARGDFRLLFSALIGVALGLAGLMARGFGWF